MEGAVSPLSAYLFVWFTEMAVPLHWKAAFGAQLVLLKALCSASRCPASDRNTIFPRVSKSEAPNPIRN
jgi:hypothetical protein